MTQPHTKVPSASSHSGMLSYAMDGFWRVTAVAAPDMYRYIHGIYIACSWFGSFVGNRAALEFGSRYFAELLLLFFHFQGECLK